MNSSNVLKAKGDKTFSSFDELYAYEAQTDPNLKDNFASNELKLEGLKQYTLSNEDKKQIDNARKFNKQIDELNDSLGVKRKKGTDYKIYSTTPSSKSLFPFITNSYLFVEFLNFLNSCMTMRANEKIANYFSSGILNYIKMAEYESPIEEDKYTQEDIDKAKELEEELSMICEKAQNFALKKYSNINGFKAVSLAYEKMYNKKYLTAKDKRLKGSAIKDIIYYLNTDLTPKEEITGIITIMKKHKIDIDNRNKILEDLDEANKKALEEGRLKGELTRKLQREHRNKEMELAKETDSVKITEYMDSLPEGIKEEVIEQYKEIVIPQIKSRIEAKENKDTPFNSTEKNELEKRLENYKKMLVETKNKYDSFMKERNKELKTIEDKIQNAKKVFQEWSESTVGNRKPNEYSLKDQQLEKKLAEFRKQIDEINQKNKKEKENLLDKIKITKEQISSTENALKEKGDSESSIDELQLFLDEYNFNYMHLDILHRKFMNDLVDEQLQDYTDEINQKFKDIKESKKMEFNRIERVKEQIDFLVDNAEEIIRIANLVDSINANKGELFIESKEDEEIDKNKFIKQVKEAKDAYIESGNHIEDIIKLLSKLEKEYEEVSDFLEEITEDSESEEAKTDINEIIEDIDEEINDSLVNRDRIFREINSKTKDLNEEIETLTQLITETKKIGFKKYKE